MADSERELLEIIGSIYASIEDPVGWAEVLRRLTNMLQATVGTLDLYDLTLRRGDVAVAFNLDPDFGRLYNEQFAGKNAWMNSPRARTLSLGAVTTGQMLVLDEELERSEFYQELLRPQDIFHLVGSRVLEQGVFTANLSLLRPKSKGPFSKGEVALVRCLIPHLLRAMQVQSRLGSLAEREDALNDILDLLPFGVILADRSGKPVLVNRPAAEIAATRDGLILRREGLFASSAREGACLLQLISTASAACAKVGLRPGGTIRLSMPSRKPDLVVLVAPLALQGRRFLVTDAASAVLFITDPTTDPPKICDAVAALFNLTLAEMKLCRHLAHGRSLGETARDLGVSSNTVRTHLKRVFEKTGTHRQAELVLLLTKGVPNVRCV